jgi:hypothetical protein
MGKLGSRFKFCKEFQFFDLFKNFYGVRACHQKKVSQSIKHLIEIATTKELAVLAYLIPRRSPESETIWQINF